MQHHHLPLIDGRGAGLAERFSYMDERAGLSKMVALAIAAYQTMGARALS